MKLLKFFIGLKLFLFLVLGVTSLWVAQAQNGTPTPVETTSVPTPDGDSTQSAEDPPLGGVSFPSKDEVKVASADEGVPTIPKIGSLKQYEKLKQELLILRSDTEVKLKRVQTQILLHEKLKKEVQQTLEVIENERKLLSDTLQREQQVQEERLTASVELIGKMEPKKAAPLFESMDRDLALALLQKLPSRQTTKILEALNPTKATELMEFFSRVKSGREYKLLKDIGLCESAMSQKGSELIPTDSALSTQNPSGNPKATPTPGAP